MVSIVSMRVKLLVVSALVVLIAWLFLAVPSSNSRAIAILGLILLTEAYFLGIDSSIVKRIIRMKPLNRVINGLYYVIVGFMVLVVVAFGNFAFPQWVFAIFVCILGATILIYQAKKGPKPVFVHAEEEKKVAALTSEKKKAADTKPAAPKAKGLKATIRKYEFYTYLVSLGSDLSVTALFFAIFALIDFGTALLLFILGYIIRFVGDLVAKKAGVVKEQVFAEEFMKK